MSGQSSGNFSAKYLLIKKHDMTGYINGSDLLCSFGGAAFGHCTSHTASFSTETKDVAVKPAATSELSKAALYKRKRVTGLSVQVKCDGLQFYKESEGGFQDILAPWSKGKSVELKLFARSQNASPYASGKFIITSLEQNAPAGEDATYSATFDNDGPVEIDEGNVDLNGTTEEEE